jgi:hypothetical protein
MAPHSAGHRPFEATEETIDGPGLIERRDVRLVAGEGLRLPDTMKDRPGMAGERTAADADESCVESGQNGRGESFVSEASTVQRGDLDGQ